ncbi:hypothetical protein N9I97_01290 [bacterium]|nr:hypothetical protein [bacterium]
MRYSEIKLVEPRVLAEGQGLRAAAPGEIYVDRDGTEYSFVVWDFKYPNDADRFETQEAVALSFNIITLYFGGTSAVIEIFSSSFTSSTVSVIINAPFVAGEVFHSP